MPAICQHRQCIDIPALSVSLEHSSVPELLPLPYDVSCTKFKDPLHLRNFLGVSKFLRKETRIMAESPAHFTTIVLLLLLSGDDSSDVTSQAASVTFPVMARSVAGVGSAGGAIKSRRPRLHPRRSMPRRCVAANVAAFGIGDLENITI